MATSTGFCTVPRPFHPHKVALRNVKANSSFQNHTSRKRFRASAQPLPHNSTLYPSPPNPKFDWRSQWYPLALLCDLDSAIPTQRIDEQGRLECGYHGWQFDQSGICTRIPQSPVKAAPTLAACAKRLPCVEQGGILFAWLGNLPPPKDSHPAVVEGARARHVISSYCRTLPLCFTTLLQNVLDPAHIHFAHHNQIGRRELAAPVPIRILERQSPLGFTADYYSGRVLLTFRPPCLIEIVTSDGLSFAYYAIPVQAGIVRTIAISASARKPLLKTPRWLDHLRRHELVEGDLKLMMTQEDEMRQIGMQAGKTSFADVWDRFYMPTSADRLILEMRRWLQENAPEPSEEWFGFKLEGRSRDALCSRSHHTISCSSCSSVVWTCDILIQFSAVGLLAIPTTALLVPNLQEEKFLFLLALFGTILILACQRVKGRINKHSSAQREHLME